MACKRAGTLPDPKELADIPKIVSDFYELRPDPANESERVAFGTSGHRGSASKKSFNEAHIVAICDGIASWKERKGISGPLYIGRDTHALSLPAWRTAIGALVDRGVEVVVDDGYTPTPVISFAILRHNTKRSESDGIVVTPSHNPPEDGGIKYNPPNGGPADVDVTSAIADRANEVLGSVKAAKWEEAAKRVHRRDLKSEYVQALKEVVDMDAIRTAKLKVAVDPLGGSAIGVYERINEIYDLGLELKNAYVDPTFSFVPLDHDCRIRMDCSSPYAMARLVELRHHYDLAFANDTDADRHGIVTREGGLMNPNHYLSVMIWYLFNHRSWPKDLKVGKTLVSSSMIDRVAESLHIEVYETPVGFKWFSQGLFEEWLGFAGEESAGASFLTREARVWTTDKDGIIPALLAMEMMAKTGKDPAQIYAMLEERFGKFYYRRIDVPASKERRKLLKNLDVARLGVERLVDEPIEALYTEAPGNGQPIGGVKIVSAGGWVAMRPSGTEDIYKIYAESFRSPEHLQALIQEAQSILERFFAKEGV